MLPSDNWPMIARFPLLVWHDQFKINVLARRERTGANRGNGGRNHNLCSLRFLLFKSGSRGVVELDFDKSISDGVNIYAKRDGDADFVFLARDTASPYIDNRPLLVATKPELREYKAVYVQSDAEIGLFSDDVVVNCAPSSPFACALRSDVTNLVRSPKSP